MINAPIISILLPVKNCEKYITYAIDSILNQSFKNYELLILDSSTDKTTEIILKFKDARIKYHYLENYSLSQALNYGVEFARGEYLARMDADDISNKNRLQLQYDFLIYNKQIDILGTNYFLVNRQNSYLYKKKMPELHRDIELNMPLQASVLHPTLLIKRNILKNNKYYDIIAEDYDLFLRLLKGGYKFHNLQEYLYGYRYKIIDFDMEIMHNKVKLTKGNEYINFLFERENNLKIYYFQLGILEYYSGNMTNSRKYFLILLKSHPSKFILIFRFLIVTFFSGKLVKYLRRKRYINFINKEVNRVIKYEPRKFYYYNEINK